MTRKILSVGCIAVLFCLTLVSLPFAQESGELMQHMNEGYGSWSKPGPDYRLDPDANWYSVSALPNEAELRDTHQFRVNEDSYDLTDRYNMGPMMDSQNIRTSEPCVIAKATETNRCREFFGG